MENRNYTVWIGNTQVYLEAHRVRRPQPGRLRFEIDDEHGHFVRSVEIYGPVDRITSLVQGDTTLFEMVPVEVPVEPVEPSL